MKVVIAGYGVEGKASYDYWRALGDEVAVADERLELAHAPEGARLLLGPSAFHELDDFDLIVRSPGVAPKKLPYGDKVWSATNEFFTMCKSPIIGITGTKGKGTTSSLIASILRAAGETIHLVGNIGVPALEALPQVKNGDIIVYELSSFQLWDACQSPYVAVILGIEPDHLDVHKDFEDYIAAKANIVRYQHQPQVTVWKQNNEVATHIAQQSEAILMPYPDQDCVYADEDFFWYKGEKLCATTALQLPGKHNIDNACAAITVCSCFIKEGLAAAVEEGLSSFTGLAHRLKFVAKKHGVSYYDDSIATTPGSAVAAMQSFEAPKILLLGGSSKGAIYDDVIAAAKVTNTKVIAMGQTGAVIEQLCRKKGVEVYRETGGMHDVVGRAKALAKEGEIVILSPASASFDQYKSYADRGEQFIAAVEGL